MIGVIENASAVLACLAAWDFSRRPVKEKTSLL
jgi:hypothetical protein